METIQLDSHKHLFKDEASYRQFVDAIKSHASKGLAVIMDDTSKSIGALVGPQITFWQLSVSRSCLSPGTWLYREHKLAYWRLTEVSNGMATGKWIKDSIAIDMMTGEWMKPDDEQIRLANQDHSGRLFGDHP